MVAPHIRQILIADAATAPMKTLSECLAVAGWGLQGDRYYSNAGTFSPKPQRPDFEITFIETESIESFSRETGLPFTAADARRNIVTMGVQLNELVGACFSFGEVTVRGIRLCEPCTHLARTSVPDVLKGLVHKGGLRAQIVRGGMVRIGDAIRFEIAT
jgi:hypothetical protein